MNRQRHRRSEEKAEGQDAARVPADPTRPQLDSVAKIPTPSAPSSVPRLGAFREILREMLRCFRSGLVPRCPISPWTLKANDMATSHRRDLSLGTGRSFFHRIVGRSFMGERMRKRSSSTHPVRCNLLPSGTKSARTCERTRKPQAVDGGEEKGKVPETAFPGSKEQGQSGQAYSMPIEDLECKVGTRKGVHCIAWRIHRAAASVFPIRGSAIYVWTQDLQQPRGKRTRRSLKQNVGRFRTAMQRRGVLVERMG
nr:hypothetical protein CFP56_08101 [Quercus suber]